MSDFCSVFEYKSLEGVDSMELLALRASERTDNPSAGGRLYVPEGVDELHEDLVRGVEIQTGGRVDEIVPIDAEMIEPVCGVRTVGEQDDAGDDQAPGLWVAFDTSGFNPSFEKPDKLSEEAYWNYVYLRQGIRPNDPRVISADNWSLCIVKPDAKEKSLEDEIFARIGVSGLKVVTSRSRIEIPENQLDQIWPSVDANGNPLPPNPWWNATVEYMTSGAIDALLVYGANASMAMKALKNQLRAEHYGEDYQNDLSLPMIDRVKSIIHTSDCDPELLLNVSAFWNQRELGSIVNGTKLDPAA